jgi:membrane-bound ClpP family serine protease
MPESMLIWGLLLLAAAAAILILDVFIPSAGLLSLTAGVLSIAGVVCLFRHDYRWGLAGLSAVLVLGPMIFLYGLKILPNTPIGRGLLFGDGPPDELGQPKTATEDLAGLVGKQGVAISDLRPVGTVKIDGRKMDALAELNVITAGTAVRVTQVNGFEVKVRPVA